MRQSGITISTFFVAVSWCGMLCAERAPLSQERLTEEADVILTGEIIDFRVETERAQLEPDFGNYDWAIYLTIKIDEVKKGQFEPSETVVRCFRIKSRKSAVGYLTPSGHHPIPDVGAKVRAYIDMSDGSPRVIFPNGFQPVSESETLSDAGSVMRLSNGYTYLLPLESWVLIAIVGGTVLAIWMCVLAVRGRRRQARLQTQ